MKKLQGSETHVFFFMLTKGCIEIKSSCSMQGHAEILMMPRLLSVFFVRASGTTMSDYVLNLVGYSQINHN